MGNEQERQQLLEAVASDCQRAAQLDWASELFLYANAPRPALNLLNLQISDLLEPGFHSNGEMTLQKHQPSFLLQQPHCIKGKALGQGTAPHTNMFNDAWVMVL